MKLGLKIISSLYYVVLAPQCLGVSLNRIQNSLSTLSLRHIKFSPPPVSLIFKATELFHLVTSKRMKQSFASILHEPTQKS